MRRTTIWPVAFLLLVAACASTPRQRELQAIGAIQSVNGATVTALDYGVISADEGEAVQVATRTATSALKGAIAARKAGKALDVYDAILSGVQTALAEALRILEGRQP